jgi:GntR family transcriptional regulator, phosphonate transport system regulatory protein
MTPVWRQIERELRSRIASGCLTPGQKLPTEHELAAQFDVHRNSIRKVLARLSDAGLIRTHQGKGAFVCERVVPFRVAARTRFSENLRRAGVEPGTRLIEATEQFADSDMARHLKLARGALIHRLLIINEANGRPISLTQYYFPKARFPDFGDRFSKDLSVTRTLMSFGVADYKRKYFRISSRLPDKKESELLCISSSSPVLRTRSLNVDMADTPIQYTSGAVAAERVEFVFEPSHGEAPWQAIGQQS